MDLRRKSAKLQTAADWPSRKGFRRPLPGAFPGCEEIREGDRVKVRSLDREGIVESIRDGTYVVMIGPLRYRADRDDLIRISGASPAIAVSRIP